MAVLKPQIYFKILLHILAYMVCFSVLTVHVLGAFTGKEIFSSLTASLSFSSPLPKVVIPCL